MELSITKLIIAALVCCGGLIAIAVGQMRIGTEKPKALRLLLIRAAIGSIISGLFIGTQYVHGVDVHWLVLGGTVCLVGFALACIVVWVWPVPGGR